MNGIHRLTDNRDLSAEDYAKAHALISKVRALHLAARQYVEGHDLDPAVFLPGNIWGDISRPDSFIDWTYDLVNYARCVSPFSGFDLMMWGRRDVPGQVDGARATDFYTRFFSGALRDTDIAERLELEFDLSTRIQRSIPCMTDSYDALVSSIPERYRIVAPPVAGEIGWLHHGRIVNPDVIMYQRRINALYAGGALQGVEDAIASKGSANYLEIGPGHCLFAFALSECFGGKLNVFLVDLPLVMGNGCAYLSCAAGPDRIGLVAAETAAALDKPFVCIANYLVPHYEHRLPDFDLVHNAISLNEMTAQQVAYYFDFVERHLAPDGIFHISRGTKLLDYHVDVVAAALERFPNRTVYAGERIGEHTVAEHPNTFIRRQLTSGKAHPST